MEYTSEQLVDIIVEASQRLHSEIKVASKRGSLDYYLESIGMGDILTSYSIGSVFETDKDGKIIIFGDSQIKEVDIYGILKTFNIPKDRVELHLEYNDIKKYDFKKLQYNSKYRLIVFGPVPHSAPGKESESSVIQNLESSVGYPKVMRLTDGHSLKITKSNLKRLLEEQLRIGYI